MQPLSRFFRTMYDSIDPIACGVEEPFQLLKMGGKNGLLPVGFTERYELAVDKSTKGSEKSETKQDLLKHVTVETIIKFYLASEEYLLCNFILYIFDSDNQIMQIDRTHNVSSESQRIEVSILIAGPGVCCILSKSEEEIQEAIVERIRNLVLQSETSNPDDIVFNIPKFLHQFVEKRLSVWVEHAFYALRMHEGREYLVKDGSILPIDYRSTGVVQLNRKWSNGLHQFLQMKHKLKLKPLSLVTNYLSNIAFFKRYHISLYGMTGTLGNKYDQEFLSSTYNVELSKIPTFCTSKLFEYNGILCPNKDTWESKIVETLQDKIAEKSWKGKGRACLIICEDINSAKEIQTKILSENISKNVRLYIRNDTDQLNIILHKLQPQEIIVATNLAGRGTNIKVVDNVKESGGLFVLLTFLPPNARVERQAFGRTARKGDPGSCQIIANAETLPEYMAGAQSIESATNLRDKHSKLNSILDDVEGVQLKERLFTEYCKLLQPLHQLTVSYEEKKILASTLNEFWGTWLLVNADKIGETPLEELVELLRREVTLAKSETLEKKSPSQNFYHQIRFGNEVLLYDNDYHKSYELFTQAITIESGWAAIAYYNRAYCRIKEARDDYISLAMGDLREALKSIKNYREQELITMQLNDNAKSHTDQESVVEESPLAIQINTKFQIYNFYQKNIEEAISKLNECKNDDVDAVESSIFALVSDPDSQTQDELYILWQHGLINLYSIEKKPKFSWEGLVIFLLGALQIVAGIALTVFSAGALSNIGMGLIVEGVSDVIDGVIAMATSEFSWEQWAISKAIGIAISLMGFGIGKIISKGFKGFKVAVKSISKELKALPTLAKSQVKGGLTQVMKENLKNAGKYAGKELAEESVMRGLQFAQDAIVGEFMGIVKETIKSSIETSVHNSVFNGGLGTTMDELVLQQIGGIGNSFVLVETTGPQEKLKETILNFGTKLLDSYMKDLGWQKQLNMALQGTMMKVQGNLQKEGKLKKYKALFDIAEAVHMGALLIDAVSSITSLLNEFHTEYSESIQDFMDESGLTKYDLSSPIEGNKNFTLLKTSIVTSVTELLSEAIVIVVHQKFTGYIVNNAQKKLNGKVSKFVGDRLLKGNEIEKQLKAGQASLYISSMSAHSDSTSDSRVSYKYANEIKDSRTPGSIIDLRILSEKLGIKVSILEPLPNNKYRKMLNIQPDSTNTNSQTVRLIYRVTSAEYPEGHYEVLINGKLILVDNENMNCAYHALSKALYPNNSEDENKKKANEFRQLEAQELETNSSKWSSFVRIKEELQDIENAMWYLGIGGVNPSKRKIENDDSSQDQKDAVIKVQKYHSGDVMTNLSSKFQNDAKERWDTLVSVGELIDPQNVSKGHNVKMKYKDSGTTDEITNQKLFQTLAFYSYRARTISKDGTLPLLRIEMKIGGASHYFLMRKALRGDEQIFITTDGKDYPNTTITDSYVVIAKSLDSISCTDRNDSRYEEERRHVIRERAGMIWEAITKGADNQPDFNKTYLSVIDGKKYPYFTNQQKRAAVSLIAITQIAEPSPPDQKQKIMLLINSKKSEEQIKEELKTSKKAIKILSKFLHPTVENRTNETRDQLTQRIQEYARQKDEITDRRVEILNNAITTSASPDFTETYKSISDGKDYPYFDSDQAKAAELYIEVKKINESYHEDSDPNIVPKSADVLKQEIKMDFTQKSRQKAVTVKKTGRLPGTDEYALKLLNMMNTSQSDFDFTTIFATDSKGMAVYSPATTVEHARRVFYENTPNS